jgi:hypothetical protein
MSRFLSSSNTPALDEIRWNPVPFLVVRKGLLMRAVHFDDEEVFSRRQTVDQLLKLWLPVYRIFIEANVDALPCFNIAETR